MKRLLAAALAAAAVFACGGDGSQAGSTTTPPTVEEYCAILTGAQERASEETMEMLFDRPLPEIADLLERLERREVSAEDFQALADFNLTTCGVEFP